MLVHPATGVKQEKKCIHPLASRNLRTYNIPMTNKNCDGRHTKNDGSWWVNDARGIPLARVCSLCYLKKTSKYRKEVMSDANYWADEIIDGD